MAGVSAAYHLAKAGMKDILIVDSRPPLSLTSDRSTEGYRNWWPDPAMVALMNHSIDLMEGLVAASGNRFRMNRRGYVYLTADEGSIPEFKERAKRVAELGAGPLRIHAGEASDYKPRSAPGAEFEIAGADLLLDPGLIHKHFPYITEQTVAALHVRRAGWLSAQQLGMYMLEMARELGVRYETGEVQKLDTAGGRVMSVILANDEHVGCEFFVNAAGPFLKPVGDILGVDLPVQAELHLKVTFKDHLQVLDRAAPLLVWGNTQTLPWEAD
jgi:sarcosine oxidase, subunit beta